MTNPNLLRFTVTKTIKKYACLQDYSADTYDIFTFLAHCSHKFRNKKGERKFHYSTLAKAWREGKIKANSEVIK